MSPKVGLGKCISGCLVMLWIAAAGCAGEEKMPTVPVSGKVTYRGAVVPEGNVVFHPTKTAAGLAPRWARGGIDSQGRYSLSTFRAHDGALPGEYKVLVTPAIPFEAIDPTAKAAAVAAKVTIPAIYSDPERTPLKATIPEGAAGPQERDFELKD